MNHNPGTGQAPGHPGTGQAPISMGGNPISMVGAGNPMVGAGNNPMGGNTMAGGSNPTGNPTGNSPGSKDSASNDEHLHRVRKLYNTLKQQEHQNLLHPSVLSLLFANEGCLLAGAETEKLLCRIVELKARKLIESVSPADRE
ncbi:hypothetical protein GNI_053740 [Gregarina niphandrodes]|uniref:Uncharacterized protein n=1 Tax=Gregarina niphandrodes TaxID=110365 RepID=A0A023B954_GRENI|nr:hypothetical protein GNI_053740 [Gregarina niphandrodes]EZG71056.1 hypothetical protein GNI_053740 [Gregarina niphandrodes]|eukprot:XP_011129849.1 hypothetical protein GNI_053740 [Gregarina niphandrodes]